jgi:hypothetical protein
MQRADELWHAAGPEARTIATRFVLGSLVVAGVALVVLAGWHGRAAYVERSRIRASADISSHAASSSDEDHRQAVASDFSDSLPADSASDQQFRFAARLAESSRVTIAQMQSESANGGDSRHFPRRRLTMQLRGDYRDIKAVCWGVLDKFPGLVLQRMAIRHHEAPGATAPAGDRGDDEATIELIQYLRPARSS